MLNRDGTKSKQGTCNNITVKKAKSAQVWVGKILRETTCVDEAIKLLQNFLDHLEGKCKPGCGCQHSFDNYKHKSPINCPDMMKKLREYFSKQVIGIVSKVIIEGIGAIHTNTNESVNMLLRMMRDKIRVLGAALYVLRSDIAYLMQNQKVMTRYRPESRRHFLSEMLQKLGHVVSVKQTDTWINETVQSNLQGDFNRTEEQKQKRIKRKHSKFLKNISEGRDCADHYKSGGKKQKKKKETKVDPDLLHIEESEDIENFPATETTLKKFTTKGLRVISTSLVGDDAELTKHIPTKGKGQKEAWITFLLLIIQERQLTTLPVPVDVCPTTHHLISVAELQNPDVRNLHPQICKVRVNMGGPSLLLFFDLETTGFGIYQVQILQFGMVAALTRTGHKIQKLGSFNSYIECKMWFPDDVTQLTGIKNWFHPDSQLKGAPTLPTVNKTIITKIIEWKQVPVYVYTYPCLHRYGRQT